jgi:hypothetical protein
VGIVDAVFNAEICIINIEKSFNDKKGTNEPNQMDASCAIYLICSCINF